MLAIPFADLPAFTETLTLDGVPYQFAFAWNYAASYWSMSILDAAGNPLLQGVRVVLNLELLGQFVGQGLPPGQLWAVDPSNTIAEPAYTDLTTGAVTLVYIPEAELAAV